MKTALREKCLWAVFGLDDRGFFYTKDKQIESLRGFAILLLVIFHAREFAPTKLYEFFVFVGDPIRMPLFASISGYLYAGRRITPRGSLAIFFRGKTRRLLVPMFTVLTFWLALNIFAANFSDFKLQLYLSSLEPKAILEFYFYRPRTYWFIQAIFIVFLVVGGLDYLGLLKTPERMLMLFSCAIGVLVFLWGIRGSCPPCPGSA